MTTHTFLGRCDVPDINLLPSREERRKFRTGIYTTTIVEEVSRIDTGGGTEKNKARAKGTDTLHADALFAEFERGIRYEQLPPIVIKTGSIYKLIDWFTRVKALKKRKQEKWVFDVYELVEGCELQDLIDEIGLGANNHISSKKSDRSDFVLTGVNWVTRHGGDKSKKEIKDWVNSIPHSFSNDQVNGIVESIKTKSFTDTSVATFTEASAATYLEPLGFASNGKFNDDGLHGRTIKASANATNSPRNFCAILKDFKDTGKKTRVNIFAPNGTSAKDVKKVIEAQKEEFVLWAEAIQEMAVHIKADKNWMPFEFGVRPTQLVDHDPDGSYVPLDN